MGQPTGHLRNRRRPLWRSSGGERAEALAEGYEHMAAMLPARTRARSARGRTAWSEGRLLTPLIRLGFAQDVEAEGVLETLERQDAADVPLVETIGATSKGYGRGQVEDPPVEDLSWVRTPFWVRPDRSTATHVATVRRWGGNKKTWQGQLQDVREGQPASAGAVWAYATAVICACRRHGLGNCLGSLSCLGEARLSPPHSTWRQRYRVPGCPMGMLDGQPGPLR